MTAMQWHKLDRDRTVSMIENVRTAGGHVLFTIGTSEAKAAKLSFYQKLMIYRLTNYASLPSFTFNYLGDGTTYFYLDGSPGPIYAANDSGDLFLTPDNVAAYVSFFFDNVSGPDGDIYVIDDDPQNHPALSALGDLQMDSILMNHQPPEVSSGDNGGYIIKASMYYLASLVRAAIQVDRQGRVSIRDFEMLLSSPGHYSSSESVIA